jgi:Bacterial Ig domain
VARKPVRPRPTSLRVESLEDRTTPTGSPGLRANHTFTGPAMSANTPTFPASPTIAVGKSQTVAVVKDQLQIRSIPNGSASTVSLQSFFGPAGPSGSTVWSSPRAVYDPYADRFVVSAIGTVSAGQTSVLFAAVSDNADPTGAWYYQSVSVNPTIAGSVTGAGYMGMGLDEEAVYIATSQYAFSGGAFKDARVLILDKTIGANGGWYNNGTVTTSALLDPDGTAGNEARYEGLVPATMYANPLAPAGNIGTYFVAYNASAGAGANEAVQVVQLTTPTTAPTFTHASIDVGDIDLGGPLPAARQPHTGANTFDIDLGPRLTANAVWRNDRLYFGGTVKTAGGLPSAHWFQFNTNSNAMEQQANVDSSSLAAGLDTYYPAVAVDELGDLAVSYNASNSSNGVAALYQARTAADAANTLRDAVSIFSLASNEYVRRNAAGANVWGPYNAIAIAPNERVFWTFQSGATAPTSTGTAPDFGMWVTSGGAFSFNWPPDVAAPIGTINTFEDASLTPIPLDPVFDDLETNDAGLSYSVSSNNTGLVTAAIVGHSLQLTLVPDANGTANITVTVTDGGTVDALATSTKISFVINVLAVEDAPVAFPESYTIDEDTSLIVDLPGVLANDTDPDAFDTQQAILVTGPTHASSFTLGTDGSIDYVPQSDYNGADSFKYKVKDTAGQFSNTVTVTININPVNDAPAPLPDTYNVNEDTLLHVTAPGVLQNDSDVENDPLTAILFSGPSHALSFTFNANGSFDYTPAPDYNGTDEFFYSAKDPTTLSDNPAKVTINIAPIDDAPKPVADDYNAFEGHLLTVDAANGVLKNDLEVDGPPPAAGQPLTITQNTTTTHGTLVFSQVDGSFTYNPFANFNGDDTFTYFVTDGTTPEVGPVTVTIHVVPFDDPPVAQPESYTLDEDTSLTVGTPGVLQNDTDIDTAPAGLTAQIVTPPTHAQVFTLNPDGSFNYTPVANFFGKDTFTYHAKDATGPSNDVVVTLNVRPVQDAVIAVDDSANVSGKAVRINVLANDIDPDPDTLTIAGYTKPTLGKLTRSGSALIYTPLAGASGVDTFNYTVSDGHGHTDVGTVTVNVADIIKPKATGLRVGYGSRYADLFGYSKSVLPFSGINSVSAIFGEGVTVQANALTVLFNNAIIGTTMTYDPATRTATWTLATPITTVGKLSIKLSAAGVMDGSANLMAADVGKTLGVLPGDYDRNGVVSDADIKAIANKFKKHLSDRFSDVNGDGVVDQIDVDIATANKGKKMP